MAIDLKQFIMTEATLLRSGENLNGKPFLYHFRHRKRLVEASLMDKSTPNDRMVMLSEMLPWYRKWTDAVIDVQFGTMSKEDVANAMEAENG